MNEKLNNYRNLGIEALRVISMFMVIFLHILNHGIDYPKLEPFSFNWFLGWFIEALCYCAVNIYAMISGYVMVNSKPKLSRLIILWLEVLFYSGVSEIILQILTPNTMWGVKDIVKAMLPVCSQQFWYFTAYFAMFWFIPLFNWIIHNLEFRNVRYLIYLLLTIFGFFPWIAEIFGTTAFGVSGGYTALWLAVLYLVGAGIRVYGFSLLSLRKREHSVNWFFNVALLSGGGIFLSKLILTGLTVKILGREFGTAQFYSYLSPLVVLEAIVLLCFFSRLKIEKGIFWIRVGKLTFGIYLVHQTKLFGYYVWPMFKDYIGANPVTFLLVIIIGGILIFCGSGAIEYIRSKLFQVCKIEKFSNIIATKVEAIITKIVVFKEE